MFNAGENASQPLSGAWQQRACQLSSLALHVGLVSLLVLSAIPLASRNQGASRVRKVTMLFSPPVTAEKHRTKSRSSAIAAPRVRRVNRGGILLTGLHLAIAEDPQFSMVHVLSHYNGALGFAPKSQPQYVTRLFQSPGWTPRRQESWLALSGFSGFVVRLVQPEKWPVVRKLESAYGLPSDDVVYALFPPAFRFALNEMIREVATTRNQEGRVTGALIAFSRTGVVVEHVVIRPHH